MQFRLTDAVCDPPTSRQTFVEQLWRLPGCFLCYTPAPDTPPVAPLPALQNGFLTFGSFNALAKVTPEVMAVWGRVLRRVPGSRLLLKNKPFACQAAQQDFLRRVGPAAVPAALLPEQPVWACMYVRCLLLLRGMPGCVLGLCCLYPAHLQRDEPSSTPAGCTD